MRHFQVDCHLQTAGLAWSARRRPSEKRRRPVRKVHGPPTETSPQPPRTNLTARASQPVNASQSNFFNGLAKALCINMLENNFQKGRSRIKPSKVSRGIVRGRNHPPQISPISADGLRGTDARHGKPWRWLGMFCLVLPAGRTAARWKARRCGRCRARHLCHRVGKRPVIEH